MLYIIPVIAIVASFYWWLFPESDPKEVSSRLGSIKLVVLDFKYSLLMLIPFFSFLILIYPLDGMYFFTSFVVVFPFLYLTLYLFFQRKKGNVAFTLTENYQVGFLDDKTISMHLRKKKIPHRETISLLKSLKEEDVEYIHLKSHLLSDQDRLKSVIEIMGKCGWNLCGSVSSSKMGCLTRLAIHIKLMFDKISISDVEVEVLFKK